MEQSIHQISPKTPIRMPSLDLFRGLTVGLMCIVNNPGNWKVAYTQLEHKWADGWTLCDLVFPNFLFITGLALAFTSKKDLGQPLVTLKLIRRVTLIFLLGIVIHHVFDFDITTFSSRFDIHTFRIVGVLQRIAIVFFFCSHLRRQPDKVIMMVSGGLLLAYYAIDNLTVAPDGGRWSAWLDVTILGKHTWYNNNTPPDPEGILSTMPSIVTGLLGLLTGRFLINGYKQEGTLNKLGLAGLGLVFAGLVLHPFYPINKIYWSGSYVFFNGGLSVLCLWVCEYIAKNVRLLGILQPFTALGRNAILFYACSEIGNGLMHRKVFGGQHLQKIIYSKLSDFMTDGANASLVYSILFMSVWLVLAEILYKRNIIVKI